MLYEGYNHRAVAVVDALGSGHLLGPAFRARGVPVVHVRNATAQFRRQLSTFHAPDFHAAFEFTGDVAATAAELLPWDVCHVVAGTESGSDVAELLATELAVATANEPGFALARRDKRTMHRLLHELGIPVPEQLHLDAAGRIAWQTEWNEPEVVVVKPPASAGTEGVEVCASATERQAAVERTLKRPNLFGQRNDGVVVQEHVAGGEFMVNTVSVAGAHAAVEVWRSAKKMVGSNPVYDRQSLADPDEPEIRRLLDYVFTLLGALGIRWGPSHTEVFLSPRGPLVLEVATRLPGGVDPSLGLAALGTSHLDEVVESYLAPEAVAARGATRPLRRAAVGVSLIAPASGRLARPIDARPVTRLPSFHGLRLPLQPGDEVRRTVDLHTRPGGLYLCHDDPDQVDRDYEAVRDWERVELAAAVEADD